MRSRSRGVAGGGTGIGAGGKAGGWAEGRGGAGGDRGEFGDAFYYYFKNCCLVSYNLQLYLFCCSNITRSRNMFNLLPKKLYILEICVMSCSSVAYSWNIVNLFLKCHIF